jgi:hypothetical protein
MIFDARAVQVNNAYYTYILYISVNKGVELRYISVHQSVSAAGSLIKHQQP